MALSDASTPYQPRQVRLLSGNGRWRHDCLQQIFSVYSQAQLLYCSPSSVDFLTIPEYQHTNISHYLFHNCRNILGQEFDVAICDFSDNKKLYFNMDVLAIIAATIRAGGILYLLLPSDFNCLMDQDSARWSGNGQPIATLHFYQWFLDSLHNFPQFTWHTAATPFELPPLAPLSKRVPSSIQAQQQQCIDKIIHQTIPITLLTAGRGRGKSALAGQLIQKLQQQGQTVIVSAPNKSAVSTLFKHCHGAIPHFIAPDELLKQAQIKQQLEQQQDLVINTDWLIIDEAARIPLALLLSLIAYFPKVVLLTTTEGYEGTGQGFLLKLIPQLTCPYQHFKLIDPIRWQRNDPLEQWLNQLLLQYPFIQQNQHSDFSHIRVTEIQATELVHQSYLLAQFYGLLKLAHYRTSILDLRRLLDSKQQRLWTINTDQLNSRCIGALWTIVEGGISDSTLIQQIWQGRRQPAGNLVAQALCFQANLTKACELRSLRISRIAIHPDYQRQQWGSQGIQRLIEQISTEYDLISVSFGYTPELLAFWQKCGFYLIHLTHHKEASSSCYSAMMIKPLSIDGQVFSDFAQHQFQRNFPLSLHSLQREISLLNTQLDYRWTEQDKQNVIGFAYHHRTFHDCYPSLQRLAYHLNDADLMRVLATYFQQQQHKNAHLKNLRQTLQNYLEKLNK